MNNKPAFTLIELLVASTIIIVLMGIGVASFRSAGQQARNARRAADMEALKSAQVMHRTERNAYANHAGITTIATLITHGTAGLAATGYWNAPTPTPPAGTCAGGSCNYIFSSNTASSFCYCAPLEGTNRGNSTGACTWSTGNFYCVRSP